MDPIKRPETHVFRTLQPLVLASASPRRKELLRSAGLSFDIVPSNSDESGPCDAAPVDAVLGWARDKALGVADLHPDKWVLAADTIVVLEETILGKPSDPQNAQHMLARLSGKTHQVITGVCLTRRGRGFLRAEAMQTEVRFKHLTGEEIAAYVRTGEPLDKAGAYGIQARGAFMVEWIRGSYTNVVGLPLCVTLSWLLEQRVIAPRSAPDSGGTP